MRRPVAGSCRGRRGRRLEAGGVVVPKKTCQMSCRLPTTELSIRTKKRSTQTESHRLCEVYGSMEVPFFPGFLRTKTKQKDSTDDCCVFLSSQPNGCNLPISHFSLKNANRCPVLFQPCSSALASRVSAARQSRCTKSMKGGVCSIDLHRFAVCFAAERAHTHWASHRPHCCMRRRRRQTTSPQKRRRAACNLRRRVFWGVGITGCVGHPNLHLIV
jgi:hypothetical protein